MRQRRARIERKTREVDIVVEIDLDRAGYSVETPSVFLTHLLETMAHHGGLELRVRASGNMAHHVVEDTGRALGEALDRALTDRAGIRRFGHAVIPMDDALVLVAVDLVKRPYSVVKLELRGYTIEGLEGTLVEHFLETLALWGRFTLHVVKLSGRDPHHVAEAAFKGLGIALREASRLVGESVSSVKGEM